MAENVEKARCLLEAVLAEINDESTQLKATLLALPASRQEPASPPPPVSAVPPAGHRKVGRAPRGRRRDAFIAALGESPDSSAASLAKELGISANQAYGIARRLRDQGIVKKRGSRYRLT